MCICVRVRELLHYFHFCCVCFLTDEPSTPYCSCSFQHCVCLVSRRSRCCFEFSTLISLSHIPWFCFFFLKNQAQGCDLAFQHLSKPWRRAWAEVSFPLEHQSFSSLAAPCGRSVNFIHGWWMWHLDKITLSLRLKETSPSLSCPQDLQAAITCSLVLKQSNYELIVFIEIRESV